MPLHAFNHRASLVAVALALLTLGQGATAQGVSDTDDMTVEASFTYQNAISAPDDSTINLLATNPDGFETTFRTVNFTHASSATEVWVEVTSVSGTNASNVSPADYFYDKDDSDNGGVELFVNGSNFASGTSLWSDSSFSAVKLVGSSAELLTGLGDPGSRVASEYLGLKKIGKGPGFQIDGIDVVLTYTIGDQ